MTYKTNPEKLLEKHRILSEIKMKYDLLEPHLNERTQRLWVATEAKSLGHRGISWVSEATGLSRSTITKGCKELLEVSILEDEKVRTDGGGRKSTSELHPEIYEVLDELLADDTAGDPEQPLRWTRKSVRNISRELRCQKYDISPATVGRLLLEMGYSMQTNKRSLEGSSHPDRDEQYRFISQMIDIFSNLGNPVISIDSKKKELVGNYKNNGLERRLKGNPRKVNTYDFLDKKLGKVTPYGIYDIANNIGYMNLGLSHDTASFAVESIRRWYLSVGRTHFPHADKILITADGGGSNGSRLRRWKFELQKLATELGVDFYVTHFPPGMSKWNRIEHRLFSFISSNWAGQPLITPNVMMEFIKNTTTKEGLKIYCDIDTTSYPTGIEVSEEDMNQINLLRNEFHGEWNYIIYHTHF